MMQRVAVSLGKTLNAVFHLRAKQSTRCGGSAWRTEQLYDMQTEQPCMQTDMQTEQLVCWSGMTETEHSTTAGSNEEDYR